MFDVGLWCNAQVSGAANVGVHVCACVIVFVRGFGFDGVYVCMYVRVYVCMFV